MVGNTKSRNLIISASIWNFVGIFLLKSLAFITVPILTRLMSPTDYGIVSTYATYISFLGIIIGLCLNTASTNARIDFSERYNEYNSSIIKASIVIFILEIIIANLFYEYYAKILSISRLDLNIVFIIAYAEYIIATYYKINAVDFKFKNNLKISLTNAMISVGLSILLISNLENDILARLLGQGAFALFIAIYLYYLIGVKRAKYFAFSDITYALKIAIPNIFHQISNMIMSQSDRVFILSICGAVSVAKYSVVYNFGLIMQMVWNAINDVWVPWLYRALHDNKKDLILKMSKIYLYVFTFLTSIAMIIIPDCMILFAPASYFDAKKLIPPVILATYFVFLYSFFANIEIYNKKNKFMAIATFVAAIFNIAGNAVFIPKYGYEAAAYTTLVAYILLMGMHYWCLTFLIKKNIYPIRMFIPPIMYMVGVSIYVTIFIDKIWQRYIGLILILVWVGFSMYRKKEMFKKFIKALWR